MIKKQTKIGCR